MPTNPNAIPDMSEYLDRLDLTFTMREYEREEEQESLTRCQTCHAPMNDNCDAWECKDCAAR